MRRNSAPFASTLVKVAVLAFGIAGCSGGEVKTYPVTVKVSFQDGKTIEGAVVVFHSIPDQAANNGEKPVSAIGMVGQDGTCQLTTFTRGDGAVAGLHRVTIAPPIPDAVDIGAPRPALPTIPSRYQSPLDSGLTATVSPDGPNEIPIEIKRR